jgi:signal transduction histidine kinase
LQGNLRHGLPAAFDPTALGEADRITLAKGIPIPRLATDGAPDLAVTMAFLPEEDSETTGYARFLLDGTEVASELRALDDNLYQQAVVAFGAGALIISTILWFSFRRLRRSSILLEQRGRKLAEMNERLILASKAATLGSVTAHLMHGLKNPLAGLSEFVKDRESTDPADEEVRLVSQAARSMQAMVEEALQVLQDQETEGISYAFTAEEMCTLLKKRLLPLAEQREITLRFPQCIPDFSIDNLKANLILLALFNLGQNAIEATPKKGEVHFTCERDRGDRLFIRVRDDGPGLPEDMLDAPFSPRVSRKPKGSGVGLAISLQLAERADAELTLESNGPEGACFLLVASSESIQDDG